MNARRSSWVLLIVLICLIGSGKRVHACSCATNAPPCEATWTAGAVFVAQVMAIEPFVDDVDPLKGIPFNLRVRLRVTEQFRGGVGSNADVYTQSDSASCGYAFEAGRTYLVYARRYRDRWAVNYCSRTRVIEDAVSDLAYLRGPARQSSGLGTIQGNIVRGEQLAWDRDGIRMDHPFAAGRVTVESTGADVVRRYEARSENDGRYSVRVPVGKYQVTLELPETLYAQGSQDIVEVLDPRGCAAMDFWVRSNGRIAGRIIDARGDPIPNLTIAVIAADEATNAYPGSGEQATSDAFGRFEFSRLAPDTYNVGFQMGVETGGRVAKMAWLTSERGGSPMAIRLGLEEKAFVGDFTLPASIDLVSIAGRITDVKGAAVSGAWVYLWSMAAAGQDRHTVAQVLSSKTGEFAFTVQSGADYRVAVQDYSTSRGSRGVESPIIRAVAGLAAINLRFDR